MKSITINGVTYKVTNQEFEDYTNVRSISWKNELLEWFEYREETKDKVFDIVKGQEMVDIDLSDCINLNEMTFFWDMDIEELELFSILWSYEKKCKIK